MSHKTFWFRKISGFIVLAIAFIGLFGWIVMELWNAILVPVLQVGAVTFWQAIGILVLCKILFGGFKKSWGEKHKWGNEMKEKWQQMTPEEKEKFKEEWRNKCKTWSRIKAND